VSKESSRSIEQILLAKHFKEKVKYRMRSGVSHKDIPVSKYDYDFVDYCPLVFSNLRERFGVQPADYLVCK
jgi:hypothetical protein